MALASRYHSRRKNSVTSWRPHPIPLPQPPGSFCEHPSTQKGTQRASSQTAPQQTAGVSPYTHRSSTHSPAMSIHSPTRAPTTEEESSSVSDRAEVAGARVARQGVESDLQLYVRSDDEDDDFVVYQHDEHPVANDNTTHTSSTTSNSTTSNSTLCKERRCSLVPRQSRKRLKYSPGIVIYPLRDMITLATHSLSRICKAIFTNVGELNATDFGNVINFWLMRFRTPIHLFSGVDGGSMLRVETTPRPSDENGREKECDMMRMTINTMTDAAVATSIDAIKRTQSTWRRAYDISDDGVAPSVKDLRQHFREDPVNHTVALVATVCAMLSVGSANAASSCSSDGASAPKTLSDMTWEHWIQVFQMDARSAHKLRSSARGKLHNYARTVKDLLPSSSNDESSVDPVSPSEATLGRLLGSRDSNLQALQLMRNCYNETWKRVVCALTLALNRIGYKDPKKSTDSDALPPIVDDVTLERLSKLLSVHTTLVLGCTQGVMRTSSMSYIVAAASPVVVRPKWSDSNVRMGIRARLARQVVRMIDFCASDEFVPTNDVERMCKAVYEMMESSMSIHSPSTTEDFVYIVQPGVLVHLCVKMIESLKSKPVSCSVASRMLHSMHGNMRATVDALKQTVASLRLYRTLSVRGSFASAESSQQQELTQYPVHVGNLRRIQNYERQVLVGPDDIWSSIVTERWIVVFKLILNRGSSSASYADPAVTPNAIASTVMHWMMSDAMRRSTHSELRCRAPTMLMAIPHSSATA